MSEEIDHYEGIGPCIDHKKTKSLHYLGYARTRLEGKEVGLHRAIFAMIHGLSLYAMKGMDVRHRCDNPRCINPDHLMLGTRKENVGDALERGRFTQGERHHAARLNDEIVRYCRKNYKPRCKEFGSAVLAKKFGVSQKAIVSLIARKTWAHVEDIEDED